MIGYIIATIALIILIPLGFLALGLFKKPTQTDRPREDEIKGTTRSKPVDWQAKPEPQSDIRQPTNGKPEPTADQNKRRVG